MEMNRVLLKSFVFQIGCKNCILLCDLGSWIHSLLQEREGAAHKENFDELANEQVGVEAFLLEEVEEEEEELFSEKPVPLWATFDPNEVIFLDNLSKVISI